MERKDWEIKTGMSPHGDTRLFHEKREKNVKKREIKLSEG
jgi:hypothetical protein